MSAALRAGHASRRRRSDPAGRTDGAHGRRAAPEAGPPGVRLRTSPSGCRSEPIRRPGRRAPSCPVLLPNLHVKVSRSTSAGPIALTVHGGRLLRSPQRQRQRDRVPGGDSAVAVRVLSRSAARLATHRGDVQLRARRSAPAISTRPASAGQVAAQAVQTGLMLEWRMTRIFSRHRGRGATSSIRDRSRSSGSGTDGSVHDGRHRRLRGGARSRIPGRWSAASRSCGSYVHLIARRRLRLLLHPGDRPRLPQPGLRSRWLAVGDPVKRLADFVRRSQPGDQRPARASRRSRCPTPPREAQVDDGRRGLRSPDRHDRRRERRRQTLDGIDAQSMEMHLDWLPDPDRGGPGSASRRALDDASLTSDTEGRRRDREAHRQSTRSSICGASAAGGAIPPGLPDRGGERVRRADRGHRRQRRAARRVGRGDARARRGSIAVGRLGDQRHAVAVGQPVARRHAGHPALRAAAAKRRRREVPASVQRPRWAPTNAPRTASFDFRVLDGQLAFRYAVSDGDIIVEVGATSHLVARQQRAPSPATSPADPASRRGRSAAGWPCSRRSASGCAAPAGGGVTGRAARRRTAAAARAADGERRAAALAALHRDAAAVRHRQLAHQPEAQAHAAALRRRRVLVALEDAQPVRGADPGALIADRDGDAARAPRARSSRTGAPLAELQRVGEQVGHDLLDRGRIPPTLHGVRRARRSSRSRCRRTWSGRACTVARTVAPISMNRGRRTGRPDRCSSVNVVDQRLQPLHLGANDAQRRRDRVARQSGPRNSPRCRCRAAPSRPACSARGGSTRRYRSREPFPGCPSFTHPPTLRSQRASPPTRCAKTSRAPPR